MFGRKSEKNIMKYYETIYMAHNIAYTTKYEQSENGYYIEKIKQKTPNIDLGVDATYIIHLMHNGRLDSVIHQMTHYKMRGHNYILYNQGYKSGKKENFIKSAPMDLIHAYLYIFQHASDCNYKHILILEDDFFFDNSILHSHIQRAIKRFIHDNTYDLYYLGCLPYLRKEIDQYSSRLFASTGMHAVIYSYDFMKSTLDNNVLYKLLYTINDWDTYTCPFKTYMSNIPLCYQLFPETPMQQQWGKDLAENKHIKQLVEYFIKSQIKFLKQVHLDKTPMYGYPLLYYTSKEHYKKITLLEEKLQKMNKKKETIKNKFKNIQEYIYRKCDLQNLLTV